MRLNIVQTALCLALILPITANASTGVYSNTRIAIAPQMSYPAININGMVAFWGNPPSSPENRVYTGNGITTTEITNGYLALGVRSLSINDSDQVAFTASASTGAPFHVYRASAGAITQITPAPPPLTIRNLSYEPGIAADGTVTYVAWNGAQATVASGNGGPVTPIYSVMSSNSSNYSGASDSSAVSTNGTIAYLRFPTRTIYEVVTYRAGNEFLVASFDISAGAGLADMDVNNLGVAALSGGTSFSDHGIYLADSTGMTKIVNAGVSAAFRSTRSVAINNQGDIAFLATSFHDGTTFSGIYTGSDPINNKIIETGDFLDGSTVQSLVFGSYGLNEKGDVAFWAALSDGRTGVYRATLLPEPSALVLLATSAIALFNRRARPGARRRSDPRQPL